MTIEYSNISLTTQKIVGLARLLFSQSQIGGYMSIKVILLAVVIAAFGSLPAHAHHAATATFDTSQTIEIEGYVKEFSFNNPHVTITIGIPDENGMQKEWVASAPAVAGFRRWGWTGDMIEEGQYVRLVGRTARHGGPMILIERGDIEGGMLLELNPDDGSLVRILEGPKPDQTPDLAIPALWLDNGQPNLSGTFLALDPASGQNIRTQPDFTAAGQVLQDSWDSAKDPAYTVCATRGLLRVVTAIQSVRVTQRDDYVIIAQEGDNTQRLIYLDGRGPESDGHSLQGHSTARYEGDTLVVETSQLLGGPSGGGGNILSDQTTIVERYSRADNDEHAALAADITFTDPVNLAASWKAGWSKYLTGDYEFAETECHLPKLASLN